MFRLFSKRRYICTLKTSNSVEKQSQEKGIKFPFKRRSTKTIKTKSLIGKELEIVPCTIPKKNNNFAKRKKKRRSASKEQKLKLDLIHAKA